MNVHQNIGILDYGLGNLRSIQHKLLRHGVLSEVISTARQILDANCLIFPGVGHIAKGMSNLKSSGLLDALRQKVLVDRTPILGICLGMQLFTNFSEEGDVEGLGWIKAKTVRFREDKAEGSLRIPHVGWNEIRPTSWQHPLFDGFQPSKKFYFTHSYHIEIENKEEAIATAFYGYEFVCAVQSGNITGVQFHPEKSHVDGIGVILNFIRNSRRELND
jgi:glutamine amidotransferase